MKVRITQPHITEGGPVAVGTILDLHEDHASDFVRAKLAVPHVEKATEQATSNRKQSKETR